MPAIEMPPPPHVGAMLATYVKEHRIHLTGLSRYIGKDKRFAFDTLQKQTIQTASLWQVSYGLQHNFFEDIARQLPQHFTVTTPLPGADKDAEIAALKAEVARLQGEKALLMEMVKR